MSLIYGEMNILLVVWKKQQRRREWGTNKQRKKKEEIIIIDVYKICDLRKATMKLSKREKSTGRKNEPKKG